MRRNVSGKYEVTEGEMLIKDTESGEEMLFLLDEENKLVIRSLLEEDIKPVVSILKITSSEKRKSMKTLWEMIPQQGSENYAFVAEKIVGNNSDNCYEKDRVIIGVGFRETDGICVNIIKDNDKSSAILKMIEKIAEFYKIPGQPYWCPAR